MIDAKSDPNEAFWLMWTGSYWQNDDKNGKEIKPYQEVGIMGILGWMWDKIPILGIIGRHNREEERKLKELKKHTKELKKQTKELKKLQKNRIKYSSRRAMRL